MGFIKKVVFIFLLCVFSNVIAKDLQGTIQSTALDDEKVTELSVLEKRFIDERQILERQADRQYSQIKESFNWTLGCGGFLITLFLIICAYFFGKTRRETRELVDEITEKEVKKLVSKDIEPLREQLKQLKSVVDQQLSFKNRRIVWVANIKEDTESVRSAFALTGITRIEVITPEDQQSLNLGDCDLVILSYDNSPKAIGILKETVEKLNLINQTIHLILYTYIDGVSVIRVEPECMKILAVRKWFSIANFPSTMISQVVSLISGPSSTIRG
jgi:hypothetical protein